MKFILGRFNFLADSET